MEWTAEDQIRVTNQDSKQEYVFTAATKTPQLLHEAIIHFGAKKAHIQTIQEAALFRIATNGGYGSENHQLTRNLACYSVVDDRLAIQIVEVSPGEPSLISRWFQKAHELNCQGNELILNNRVPHGMFEPPEPRKVTLDDLFGRGEHPDSSGAHITWPLEASQDPGASPLLLLSCLGGLAKPYCAYVRSKGYEDGSIAILPKNLVLDAFKEAGVPSNNHVLIRPVVLGGLINQIYLNQSFQIRANTRAVISYKKR